MAYRNRPDIFGQPLKTVEPKGYRWSLVGIMIFNLGLIASNVAQRSGWKIAAELAPWIAVGFGFACIIAGPIAYRASKRQVERDLAEMMPPIRGEARR